MSRTSSRLNMSKPGSGVVQQSVGSATRMLAFEFRSLQEEPVEGFLVKLAKDDDLFEWEVAIFGPPETLYQGGYFKARMTFPHDYPFAPPKLRFLTPVWHPNVYKDGDLCISILHPPEDDPHSNESPHEKWNPVQNVRTLLLSVISLLNEPNVFSPANVDASVMYRRWCDSNGTDSEYANIISKQVSESRLEAAVDGVVIPLTLDDYCMKTKAEPAAATMDLTDIQLDDDGDISELSNDECDAAIT